MGLNSEKTLFAALCHSIDFKASLFFLLAFYRSLSYAKLCGPVPGQPPTGLLWDWHFQTKIAFHRNAECAAVGECYQLNIHIL